MNWKIILGDCREQMRLLPEASIDACIADPPYGETSLSWDKHVNGWLQEVRRLLKPCGSLWCFGSLRFFMARAEDYLADWKLSHDVIWKKNTGSCFSSDRFRRVHEIIAHFYPRNVKWSAVYKDPQRIKSVTKDVGRTLPNRSGVPHFGKLGSCPDYFRGEDVLATSIFEHNNLRGMAVHPTQKPELLIYPLIRYSCPTGGTVLDPFCGVGSTGLACQLANIDFIGIELSEKYASMARRRLSGDVRGNSPLLASLGNS